MGGVCSTDEPRPAALKPEMRTPTPDVQTLSTTLASVSAVEAKSATLTPPHSTGQQQATEEEKTQDASSLKQEIVEVPAMESSVPPMPRRNRRCSALYEVVDKRQGIVIPKEAAGAARAPAFRLRSAPTCVGDLFHELKNEVSGKRSREQEHFC